MKILAIGILFALTGCGMTAHSGEHFQLSGSPEGIRAFGDTLNGALKTAKESPDANNQYFQSRGFYESQMTVRASQPGFFQKLFKGAHDEKAGS